MRYSNLLIFVGLAIVYSLFFSHIRYSTNFLEIFFTKKSVKVLNIAKKMGSNEEILIAKKDFTQESKNELRKIASELQNIPEIQEVYFQNTLSPKLKEYMVKNYYLLADFKNERLSSKQIEQKFQALYQRLHDSVLYEPVNPYDPLALFTLKEEGEREDVFKLNGFGYLIKATTNIDTSSADLSQRLYDKVNHILSGHKDVIAIAPFFYLVENSNHIKSDAQHIMLIATILLLILYFFILKNSKLFINSILAIGSSILGAVMISSLFYESINLLTLAFGVSITTISIDYMFHYYFHNNFTPKKSHFQKNVFYGFLTTFGVFIIFSFIDIEFFSQLALFGAVSISIAFLIFSFIFVHLGIKEPNIIKRERERKGLHPLYVVIFSIVLLAISFQNLEFDYELKNLDYQNKKLIDTSKKFNEGFNQKGYQKLLISGKTKEQLLENYEAISDEHPSMLGIGRFVLSQKKCMQKLLTLRQYNFRTLRDDIKNISKKVGFSESFEKAYSGTEKLNCDPPIFDDFKFKIIKEENLYYTLALIDQKEKIKEKSYLQVIDIGKMLKQDMKEIRERLITFVYISIAFILLLLLFIAKKDFYYPLMYFLFPVSIVLFTISLFFKINIMHIFALIILLAISVDYGFYLYKKKNTSAVKIAIKYALLSTFCGFGSLVLSNTVALFSIGMVITLGISAIFLLLYVSL